MKMCKTPLREAYEAPSIEVISVFIESSILISSPAPGAPGEDFDFFDLGDF